MAGHSSSRRFAASCAFAVYAAHVVASAAPGDPPPLEPEPVHIPDYPEKSLRPSQAPIKLPGGGGVTDTGGATYTLPLQVPDGPRGMQPELSLSYGGGYGALGVGFSLSGLSSISPCAKTLASDGEVDGIDFDQTDAYCLDGAKLVGDAEDDWSEPDDIVYRTELDSFIRIIAHDAASGPQPVSFEVQRQDGSKATYGPRCVTRHEGRDALNGPEADLGSTSYNTCAKEGEVAPIYLIEEVRDRFGNRIGYAYDENADSSGAELSYRIRSIDYAYGGATNPTRRIVFHYDQGRPDPIVRYVSGAKIVNRSKLVAIEAFAPNPHTVESVWKYELAYETSPTSRRLRLTSVVMKDQFGVASWQRRFEWTDAGAPVEDTVISDVEFDDDSIAFNGSIWEGYEAGTANWVAPNDVRLMVYDADGDGLDDILYRTHPTRFEQNTKDYYIEDEWYVVESLFDYERGRIRMRRSTEDAPLSEMEDVTETLEPTPKTLTFWGPDHWQAHLGKSRVADLDGNGRNDLLLAHTVVWDNPQADPPTGGNADVNHYADTADEWLFGYSLMGETPWSIATAPEIEEIIGGPVFRESSNSEFYDYLLFTPPFQRILADLDGDGLPDHVDAQAFGPAPIDIMQPPYSTEDWSDPRSYHAASSAYQVLLSTTPSDPDDLLPFFVLDENWISEYPHARWTCNNGNALVTDYEGDGRADVLAMTDTMVEPTIGAIGIYARLRLGDAQFPGFVDARALPTTDLWGGDCGQHQPDFLLGDWNGDGLDDVLYPPGSWGPTNGPYNTLPLVRWNIGNGFGPLETFTVADPTLGARMQSIPPNGNDGLPVAWDLGTRVVDLNHDGRSDLLAYRFADDSINIPEIDELSPILGVVAIAYLSAGDHFEAEFLSKWDMNYVNLAEGWTLSQVGDVDGDGAMELVHVLGHEVDFGAVEGRAGKLVVTELPWRTRGDLLAAVEDSGTEYPLEVFEYTTSWWGSGPRPANETCDYPEPCGPRRGFPVVRQHSRYVGAAEDNSPRYRSDLHAYGDPRVDVTGRGFVGFAWHRIWDRRLGAETMRWFDNTTREDADSAPGGVFYPYAAVPYSVSTIVPDAPLPTAGEIASGSNMPGIPDPLVMTRTVTETYDYELRWTGRRLARLPSAVERYERDVFAVAEDLALAVPRYAWIDDVVDAERTITTSTTYDVYGNPTSSVTETDGGVERSVDTMYHDNPGTWLLGQPGRVERRSADAGENSDVRITVTEYDEDDVPERVLVLAQSGGICPSQYACPEELATTTELTFDGDGNLVETMVLATGEPAPRRTHTYWDTHGVYPTATGDPAGFVTIALLHPALGVPVLEYDANVVPTERTYDGFGRLLTVSRPGTATTSLSYVDAGAYRGLEISASAPDGLDVYAVTDDLGRAIERGRKGFNGAWSYSEVEYDHFGNVVRETAPSYTLPAAIDSTATFDRLGRTLSRTAPDDGVTELEHSMFATTSWDAEGHETYALRDVDGRVIETGHVIDDVETDRLEFMYGSFDQVELVLDAGDNETSIVHDAFGRVVSRTDEDRGATVLKLDGFGQVRHETRANGDAIDRAYDVLGRIVESTGPDGTETWDYDGAPGAAHRLTSATSIDDVVTEIEYDNLGRTREIRQTVDADTHSVVHQYDNYGRLKYLYYPEADGFDRFTTYYSYGSEGMLRSIEDATQCNPGVDGDPNGVLPWDCTPSALWTVLDRDERLALKDIRFGNGQLVQRTYDDQTGQLRQLSAPERITNFSYDHDGHVIERTEQVSGRTETFAYDELHRLWNWTLTGPKKQKGGGIAPTIKTAYEYSELGDLMRVTTDGDEVFAAELDDDHAHWLESTTTGGEYEYDEVGRQLDGGGRTMTWSHLDLPISIDGPKGTTTFFYDALGTRVRAESSERKTTYLGELYEFRDGLDGERHVFYVHGEPALVAQVDYGDDGETTRYVVSDPIDSATTVMTGAVVTEQAYFDPFGGRVTDNGAATTDNDGQTTFGFSGHEEDGDDLVNMGGRIYDRAQYRFLSPDPIIVDPLFGQSYNPYSYVLNNPLNLVDPTGFQATHADDWETYEEDPQVQTKTTDQGGGSSLKVIRDCRVSMNCDEPKRQSGGGSSSDDDNDGDAEQSVYRMGDYILDAEDAQSLDGDWMGSMVKHARDVADDVRRLNGEGGAPSTGEVVDAFTNFYYEGTATQAQRMEMRRLVNPPPFGLRFADFVTLSVGLGPASVSLTFDRDFQIFLGLPSLGLSSDLDPRNFKFAFGWSAQYGWLWQGQEPDARESASFHTGFATTVDGGSGIGAGVTFAKGQSADAAVTLGVRSTGAAISYSNGVNVTKPFWREVLRLGELASDPRGLP